MSLRKQSLILSVIGMIAMLTILYGTLHIILTQSFLSLEFNNVQENINRTVNAVSDDLNSLSSTAADWAYWDDTYDFVQDNNGTFVEGNLSYDTLSYLDLDFMLFLNTEEQIIQATAINQQVGEEVPISDWLTSAVLENERIENLPNLTDSITGLLQTPDGPVLLASRAILTSQSEGPSAGTLVIGRYLNEARLEALSESIRLNVYAHTVDDFQVPNLFAEGSDAVATTIQAENSTTINGFARLTDISGQPAFVLHIVMPRPIYAQAQTTLVYIFSAFVGIGILFTVSILIQINRIMSRLSWLSDKMTLIRETEDTSIDVTVSGQDEVANLGRGLREMLDALAQSRRQLQNANDSLEKLVEHRTEALVQANTSLRQEIAERKQAQAELAQARDQALEALRLKTQILANISHDARTPLSIILLRTNMLQSGRYGPITPAQNEKLKSIALHIQQLTVFINNLLEGAQIESSQIRLRYVDIAPEELLINLNETAGPLAERKNLQFTWEVDDDLPASVQVDPARFDQILSNLVGNAIKFTCKGEVHVRLYQPDVGYWALEVVDTGPGIPPAAQEHIFDAFWQVDGSLTREANRGVGLGLAIVKQLTMLMNGRITVNSQPGVGTTFVVIFPMKQTQKGVSVHAPVSVSG